MSKKSWQIKICNCQSTSNREIFIDEVDYSFCKKCGCILIKDAEGIINYTLKPKQKILPYDISPIDIIRNMKKITEQNYPNIYEDFNFDKNDEGNEERMVKSINNYLNHRKMIISTLQRLIKLFDFHDTIFYQCLFYLDTYLSHEMTYDISEKRILYILIGYFLCSLKLKEDDITEPSFDSFCNITKGIYLSMDRIAYYERYCLENMNYNIFSYSAYDWILQLISNGIVFDCEINNTNEIILINGHRHSLLKAINKYGIKLLLNFTSESLFFKYCTMYIAFSLIQIAREKYLSEDMMNKKLFNKLINLYGINYEDYKKCYEEITSEMNKANLEREKKLKEQELENKNHRNQNNNNLNEIGEYSKLTYDNALGINNNFKLKSSKVILRMKGNPRKIYFNDLNGETNLENNKSIEKPKDNKDNELILNEIKPKKEKKVKFKNSNVNLKVKGHLSIDCSVNAFKSNKHLLTINLNNKNKVSFNIEDMNNSKSNFHNNMSFGKKKNKPIKELQPLNKNTNRFNSIEPNKSIINSNIDMSKDITNDEEKLKRNKKQSFFTMMNTGEDNHIINFKKSLKTSTKLVKTTDIEGLDTNIIDPNKKNNLLNKIIYNKIDRNSINLKSINNLPEVKINRKQD